MDLLYKYFPQLTEYQKEQFAMLPSLYADWNERINVVSRKDIEHIVERHILHSLSIAKVLYFKSDTQILDVGTGGGFPGIPLAILFPHSYFTLIDSIGKKIRVVDAISKSLGLNNVIAEHIRVEKLKGKYDFIVSRAVTNFADLVKMSFGKIKKGGSNIYPNGIICLKGGDLINELSLFSDKVHSVNISDYFKEEFFKTKKVLVFPF